MTSVPAQREYRLAAGKTLDMGAYYIVTDLELRSRLDLAVLDVYDGYREAVYDEYLAASDDPSGFHQLWRQGRKAFLHAVLDRERIFKTHLFAMFEQHARDNMLDELEKIENELPEAEQNLGG